MPSRIDLTGKRFGSLVARRPTDDRDNGSVMWECDCDCGKSATVSARNLSNGHTTSCGCARGVPVERGERFGALVAVDRVGTDDRGQSLWKCVCDCGGETTVRAADLRYGAYTSCGCGMHAESLRQKAMGYVDGTSVAHLGNKLQRNNKSGIRGVSFESRSGKWIAQIKLRGKNRRLGSFDRIEDAAEARRQAEEELFDPILEENGRQATSEACYQENLMAAIERQESKENEDDKDQG